MQQNRILEILKSSNATLGVLALALIAQMPHAADVFRLIVHGDGWGASAHSYTFAVALELAVLLFVVQGRHAESYGFAAVSIAMNLSYYHLHDVQLFNGAALPALLVSVALPVAIARYSHAVAVAPVHFDGAKEVPNECQTGATEQTLQPAIVQVHDRIATEMELIDQLALQKTMQDEIAAQHGELIVHDDRLMDLQERIAALQSEGLDTKWIATKELADIAGTQLASLLNVDASTISRWRKAAKRTAVEVT